jgi:hypothetical protein
MKHFKSIMTEDHFIELIGVEVYGPSWNISHSLWS